MRTLMIAPDLDKGGVGSVVMTLYRSLISRGVHCDLTYYQGNEPSQKIKDEIEHNGSNLWKLNNFKTAGFWGYINQVKKLCSENKYDVVHIHTSLLIWIAGIGARLGGTRKIVGHAHGAKFLNYSKKTLLFLEPIGRKLNRTVCTDFVSCSKISAQYTFGREAVFIPNYIFPKVLTEVSEGQIDRAREQLGLEKNEIIFGYMGCLDGVKKAHFIIDVLEELRKSGINAGCFLAGNTENPAFFTSRIHQKNLEDHIKLLGFRNDCDILIQVADYYITASESEGMSVSLVEAQMAGKPCITSSLLPPENDLKIDLMLRIDGYDACQWADEIRRSIATGFKAKSREKSLSEVSRSEFGESVAIHKLMNIYSENGRTR